MAKIRSNLAAAIVRAVLAACLLTAAFLSPARGAGGGRA
jgi:hypothetical protein